MFLKYAMVSSSKRIVICFFSFWAYGLETDFEKSYFFAHGKNPHNRIPALESTIIVTSPDTLLVYVPLSLRRSQVPHPEFHI